MVTLTLSGALESQSLMNMATKTQYSKKTMMNLNMNTVRGFNNVFLENEVDIYEPLEDTRNRIRRVTLGGPKYHTRIFR